MTNVEDIKMLHSPHQFLYQRIPDTMEVSQWRYIQHKILINKKIANNKYNEEKAECACPIAPRYNEDHYSVLL